MSCSKVLRVAVSTHQWIYSRGVVWSAAFVMFELLTGFTWRVSLVFENRPLKLPPTLPISAKKEDLHPWVRLEFVGVLVVGRNGELLDFASGCVVHLRRYFCASAHGTSTNVSWPQPFTAKLVLVTHSNWLINLHKPK